MAWANSGSLGRGYDRQRELAGIITEAKNKHANSYESAIVAKINGDDLEPMQFDRQITRIVDSIKANPKAPKVKKARHLGKASFPLSDIWKRNGGHKTDSVTDFIIDNHRVSLKTGKAQLFAHGKEETKAMLMSVAEVHGYKTKIMDELKVIVEGFSSGAFDKKTSKLYGRTITGAKKAGDETILALFEFHTRAQDSIRDIFNNTPQFQKDVVREALTGSIKFGSSEAAATHIMSINKNGTSVSYYDLSEDDVINKVNAQSRPEISFSSNVKGGKGTMKILQYASVMRMPIPQLESVNEGILDWVKNLWEGLVDLFKQGLQAVLDFFDIDVTLTDSGYEL